MTKYEDNYFDLLECVLNEGVKIEDRTGTGTYSVFDADLKVDLTKEPFPILSSREFKIHQPAVEMIGFMRGETNANWYKERGCPFWNQFGLPEDVYKQIRKQDYEMAYDFCSDKGKYKATDPQYSERYKQLNALPYEEGRALLDKHDISQYKDVLVAKQGELGPIYGHMWRNWPSKNGMIFDQLKYAFNELKNRPYNRRILINGWNPAFMPDFSIQPHENVIDGNMSLTPCHVLHTYVTAPIPVEKRIDIYNSKVLDANHKLHYADPNRLTKLKASHIPEYYLDLCWFQRSWDVVLGAPANMAGYAIMLTMMAKCQNMIPRYVAVKAVNVHIYINHLEGVKEMLRRRDKGLIPKCSPTLSITKRPEVTFIDQFESTDISLINYVHLDPIKFKIAI